MTDKNLKQEVRSRTIGYILAGFGFVAGLAWNEAIKGLIDQLFPLGQGSLIAKFIYALFVTLIVVVAVTLLHADDNK